MQSPSAASRTARHNVPGRKELIQHLRDQGMSEREIAKRLRISKTTVHHWLTHQPETENDK